MITPVNVDLEACFNNPEIYDATVALLQEQGNTKEDAESMLVGLMVHLGLNVEMRTQQ